MKTTPVQSTTLASISYAPSHKRLVIEFRDHAVYRYHGVPVEVYADFLAAESKGVYFNRAIRGHYKYDRQGNGAPETSDDSLS